MKDFKAEFGDKYGLTIAIPASYCQSSFFITNWEYTNKIYTGYLKGFDVQGLVKYVDNINVMSYDIHVIFPTFRFTDYYLQLLSRV